MRKKLLFLFWLLMSLTLFTACQSARLESGGAYAPAGQVADMQFYQIDAAYDLAYSSIDGVFKFERDNREALWKLAPNIKHTLDSIRPQAWDANVEYLKARAVYIANPVPANLTPLQTALAKIKQLLITANSVIPKN